MIYGGVSHRSSPSSMENQGCSFCTVPGRKEAETPFFFAGVRLSAAWLRWLEKPQRSQRFWRPFLGNQKWQPSRAWAASSAKGGRQTSQIFIIVCKPLICKHKVFFRTSGMPWAHSSQPLPSLTSPRVNQPGLSFPNSSLPSRRYKTSPSLQQIYGAQAGK